MRRFQLGQRVVVHRTAYGHEIGAMPGAVVRLRRADEAAWIQLDKRHPNEEAHPFPLDDNDDRSTHVVAWPEDCELERLRVVRKAAS